MLFQVAYELIAYDLLFQFDLSSYLKKIILIKHIFFILFHIYKLIQPLILANTTNSIS
jgi:hypothetical protein